MREILFRGKIISSNEWVYGGIAFVGDIHFITDEVAYSHMVEADTISQYTGFDDCSDSEIFEGDIVYNKDYEEYGVVEWNEDKYSYYIKFDCSKEPLYLFYWYELELCGNKWDNKELLEE